jgi:hypothetical protein
VEKDLVEGLFRSWPCKISSWRLDLLDVVAAFNERIGDNALTDIRRFQMAEYALIGIHARRSG